MKAITLMGVVAAMALGGCAVGTEEQTNETQEALPFSLTARGHVGPSFFHVSQGGWVEVNITGFHLSPPGCSKVPAAKLILVRRGPTPVDVAAVRAIKPDGKPKMETWNNLPAGDYELAIDPVGDFAACRWIGDVFETSI